MTTISQFMSGHAAIARLLDRLRPYFLLATRLWVSWQFLKAGWLKITDWDTTLLLFREEYQVPLLPPTLAAVCGTFGELFFPLLLVLGFFSRFGAAGLLAVNTMAVVSYWHVLGGEGYEAALAQHVLWGYMLAVILLCGAGALSFDEKSDRR
jgi:putative oxidoreductase